MTTNSPAYENVPAEIPYALSIEDAAQRVGMKVAYFRTTMTKLNASGRDLRTPAQPGERARKYDIDKLDAWKAERMPVPKDSLRIPQAKPGAHEITATATRKGSYWLVDLPEIGQGTQTENLRNAHRVSHALAVEKLGVSPDEVNVNLTIVLPADAARKWDEAKSREREAREAAALASSLSREVVRDLKGQGFTFQDIGEVLGISMQRAQQLSQESR